MAARLSGDFAALLAERDRLEEFLQSTDDWRALMQLKARREKGDDLSTLNSAQLENLLLNSLAENPYYQRRQCVLADLEALQKGSPPAAMPPAAAPAKPVAAAEANAPPPTDDLTRIRGIDAALMRRLQALDVWTFEDIADWWASDVHHIAATLGVGSRISAQNWIEQAAMLSLARPGGPRMSAKAKAAAAAKAEAEAKAKAEAIRLAAEAKVREEAEAKAREAAAKAAAAAKLIADAAAKKVAEAATRIAAEAQAAAAVRERAEVQAAAQTKAPSGESSQPARQSVRPDGMTIELQPLPQDLASQRRAGVGPVVSSPAAIPANLAALLAETARPGVKESPAQRASGIKGAPEIHLARPVAETIFRSVPKPSEATDESASREARLRVIDADIVSSTRQDEAKPKVPAPAAGSRPPANPNSSIDDAIRLAVAAANQRPRSGLPAQPAGTGIIPRGSSDPSADAAQRGELLPPIGREVAGRVRERMGEDIAEVIFDRTRYAAYRAKPEEANVDIVRRQRRDAPRIPPPPVPTAAAIEARPELQSGGSDDRFLKALKGN